MRETSLTSSCCSSSSASKSEYCCSSYSSSFFSFRVSVKLAAIFIGACYSLILVLSYFLSLIVWSVEENLEGSSSSLAFSFTKATVDFGGPISFLTGINDYLPETGAGGSTACDLTFFMIFWFFSVWSLASFFMVMLKGGACPLSWLWGKIMLSLPWTPPFLEVLFSEVLLWRFSLLSMGGRDVLSP